MSQDVTQDKAVILARIGKTHGIKGWLKLNSFTSPPENILAHRHFQAQGGQTSLTLEMDAHQGEGESLLAHFSGYDDPESARQLTGLALAVPSSDLPALPEGEYYWYQLEGQAVVNREAQRLGFVRQLLETGANDVLVVAPDADSIDNRERLIPYLPDQVVLRVDLEAGEIMVDWPADYLA